MRLAVVVSVLLLPAIGRADPGVRTATLEPPLVPPGMVLPVDRPEEPPARPATTIERVAALPGGGHTLGIGTALTVPSGKVEVSFRMLASFVGGVGLAVGLSKTTEVWVQAGGSLPSDDGGTKLGGVGAKQVLGRGERWQLAAVGSVHHLDTGSDNGRVALLGAVVTACTAGCGVMASFGGQLLLVPDENTMTMLAAGVSIGGRHRFFVEGISAGGRNDRLFAIALGGRFSGKQIAFDVGLVRPLIDDDVPPLPMVSLLVRGP